MNTQKNAAWYRHQSWHRQTIIPALMPCSNGAWRFLPLPDRAKHKQKKARNYAGLAAFHAIRCLAVPDAESFPLDHQQLTQVRVVKGIFFDRHRPLPSLLPSGKQVLCWRGFTRHRLIINQRQSYRTSDCTSASHVECNPMCSMLGNHVGCSVGQPFLLFSESCSSPQPPPAQVIGDLELLIQS